LFLLRIVGLLAVIAIGASAVLYLFTGERRYLAIALRIARYTLVAALAVFALLVLERLAVLV
jgi:hypothetical protein